MRHRALANNWTRFFYAKLKFKLIVIDRKSQALDSDVSLHYTAICNDCFNYEPSAPSSAIYKSVKLIYSYGRTPTWNQADSLPPTHFYYKDAKTKTHFMKLLIKRN